MALAADLFGPSNRVGPVINAHAAASSATSTTPTDVETGAALAVTSGKRLVIAGGVAVIAGASTTFVLEDEDGNDLGPVITTPNAASVVSVPIPPIRVPTAAKTVQMTTTGADVLASLWIAAYLEEAT